jgi:hypothetical protein
MPSVLIIKAAKLSFTAEVHKIFRKLIVIFGVEREVIWYNTIRNFGIF